VKNTIDSKSYKLSPKITAPFIAFLIFTILLSNNVVDSGNKADQYQLNGADIGWFHPYGVFLSGLCIVATFVAWAWIITYAKRKQTDKTK
jgi:hypothetical protein